MNIMNGAIGDPFAPVAQVACDLADISVMICLPVNRDIPWQTVKSLIETHCLFQSRGLSLDVKMQVGCSVVEMARSIVANEFLKSTCNRLFWIDSDVVWEPQDFLRLVALSTKLPVVGGLYPAKCDPTLFMLDAHDLSNIPCNEFGCLSVKGVGMGFTVVQRGVIEALAEKAPKLMFPGEDKPIAHIFRCDNDGERFRGEDMAFFADVRALGHQVWLDPSITLGHVGAKEFKASVMDVMQVRTAD